MTEQTHMPATERSQSLRVGVVGAGRLGATLATALREAGHEVHGPAGRGERPAGDVVILCVPDAEIPAAAETVAGAPLVGHTSGATPLAALDPAGAPAFGFHPLQTFPAPLEQGALARFAGVDCAVAGSTGGALATATELAASLGMRPFAIDDEGRAAYH